MLVFVDLEERVPADYPKGEPPLSHCAIATLGSTITAND